MSRILTPKTGVGAELRDLLSRELSIPKKVKWFEVRFACDEPVTVKCEYYPDELPAAPEEPEQPEGTNYGGLNG